MPDTKERHGWNHCICDSCWAAREPDREPVKFIAPDVEYCCFCGGKTRCGIYVREKCPPFCPDRLPDIGEEAIV